MFEDAQPSGWDRDGDGIPDVLDMQVDAPSANEPVDVDADGVPDAIDPHVTSPEEAEQMTNTITNIGNMKHEALKGIAQNLRG